MDYLNGNLEVLKNVKEELYYDVIAYQKKKSDLDDRERVIPELSMGKDGNPILLVSRNGKQYRLNSLYRPIQEAKKWAEQFNYQNYNLVFAMYGFGNGYFVRELASRLKQGDKILVLEPNEEVFLHVLQHYNVKDLLEDESVEIFLGEKGSKVIYYQLGEVVHWSNLNSYMECKHPGYEELFPEGLVLFYKASLDNRERLVANRNTEERFSMDIIRNLTNNMKYIPGSNYFESLFGLWSNEIPVIIVAAGPSLDNNIEELKNAKGKAIILATDTSLRALHKHEIEPDVVISIDPRKSKAHFIDAGYEEIPMICTSNTSKHVMENHKGKKIWFNCHDYFIQLHQKLGIKLNEFSTGGSVATNAFTFANRLGMKTIILVGQDLAYKGEYTHTGGQKKAIVDEEKTICYLEGIDGKPVKSRFDWQFYLNWLERSIRDSTQESDIVIDATEGGALIHGSVVMPLKEAIEKYCTKEIHVKNILNQLKPTLNDQELKRMVELLEKDYMDLSYIIRKSLESIEVCNKIIKEFRTSRTITPSIEKKVKRISKNNKYIGEKDIYFLAEEIMKNKDMKMLQSLNDVVADEVQNTLNTYENQKQMMVVLKESAEELMPYLRNCIDSLKASPTIRTLEWSKK